MIYVTSDLHGYCFEKFLDFLKDTGFSDKDYLYILGDVIDRGKDGIKYLKWLMLQSNVFFIMGNHEAMMLSCDFLCNEITEESINDFDEKKVSIYTTWLSSGGQATVNALAKEDKDTVCDIFDFLRETPLYEIVSIGEKDFILTHSGLGSFREDKKLREYTPTDLLWSRPSLNRKYFDNITTVFGHTPTFCYGEQYRGKPLFTDTWINIDAGAAAGIDPVILRLDDMKVFYMSGSANTD